ncbi:MAG: prolyl oligopeptidase family serine peptidase [Planctomycetota bacterium]
MQTLILSLFLFAAQPTIERVLPPVGKDLPAEERQTLTSRLRDLERQLAALPDPPATGTPATGKPATGTTATGTPATGTPATGTTATGGSQRADVAIYLKAVNYALIHNEFYAPADAAKAHAALDQAAARLESLRGGKRPWSEAAGLVVRGYQSALDNSVQPYGLVIPPSLDRTRPVPLYVWLHGRGDTQTDLHFIHERERSRGTIAPPDTIVLHPFGRHCLGFKSAGEIDVLEAIEQVCREYNIDRQRIVLIGFSMGGAGAWHLGAHYTDRWCVVSPGAGFAETAEYNKLTPDRYPPRYEQQLWGCYDVPNYVRNLFNVPVIAYSGEKDKQIQAARIMEAAYRREGRTLQHLIGPNVEHKYEPETLKELLHKIAQQVQTGGNPAPDHVQLQTRTLRYHRQFWVSALGLKKHWEDSRVDARQQPDSTLTVTTQNITLLSLSPPQRSRRLQIDGQTLTENEERQRWLVQRQGEQWVSVAEPFSATPTKALHKQPGLQGPIDDAFLAPFLMVLPSGRSTSSAVQDWVEQESKQAINRWRAICRGEPRVKRDVDVTAQDILDYNLILWGDRSSNELIERMFKAGEEEFPFSWSNQTISVRKESVDSRKHILALIYPNPLNSNRYVVLNSGLTFREAADRTNSQQNPKLPDWALIDLQTPRSATAPGRIVAADFFDEEWR